MDPGDLRRKNLVRLEEMPWRTGLSYRDGVPIAYDPGDYVKMFDLALERLGYAGWRVEQAKRRGTSARRLPRRTRRRGVLPNSPLVSEIL